MRSSDAEAPRADGSRGTLSRPSTKLNRAPANVPAEEPPPEVRSAFHVAIVGAGLGGICAAVFLKRLGIPFTIIDSNAGVGGTWWVNDYPEARVDVPSHHYQYTFEKNYPWQHHFGTREELQRYVQHVVKKYELTEHLLLNTELKSAVLDAQVMEMEDALRGISNASADSDDGKDLVKHEKLRAREVFAY